MLSPQANQSEALFRKWDEWLSVIYTDIQQALVNRHIFREVMEVVEGNPKIQTDDTFYGWMRMVYSQAAVVAVRRQVDRRKDIVSIARLLEEIQGLPSTISRERFVALYKDSHLPEDIGHRHFDRYAGAGQPHISIAMVKKDFDDLMEKAASVILFSHKRVAHYDHKQFEAVPTWKELNECLNLLEALLKKYLSVFRAQAHINIVPTWQYNWKEIFLVPWAEQRTDAEMGERSAGI